MTKGNTQLKVTEHNRTYSSESRIVIKATVYAPLRGKRITVGQVSYPGVMGYPKSGVNDTDISYIDIKSGNEIVSPVWVVDVNNLQFDFDYAVNITELPNIIQNATGIGYMDIQGANLTIIFSNDEMTEGHIIIKYDNSQSLQVMKSSFEYQHFDEYLME